jgi:hypothetical protein
VLRRGTGQAQVGIDDLHIDGRPALAPPSAAQAMFASTATASTRMGRQRVAIQTQYEVNEPG